MVLFVCGDIGGTNSRLQLWQSSPLQLQGGQLAKAAANKRLTLLQQQIRDSEGAGAVKKHAVEPASLPATLTAPHQEQEVLLGEEIYPSTKHATLTECIKLFLDKYNKTQEKPYCMCLAVAGPVSNNEARITNLTWVISGAELAKTFQMKYVQIINDFVGVGYGLLACGPEDLEVVKAGASGPDVPKPEPNAPKAVIGAGTGLGECYLTFNGRNYDVFPCEGGHADFAPRNALEFGLQEFVKRKENIDRCSIERVVSGLGLPHIFDYLNQQSPGKASQEVLARIKKGEDAGMVIAQSAKAGKCPVCVQVMDIFTCSYGAEAGNWALKTLCFGGLYIAGGIAAKNMEFVRKDNQFVKNFLHKGRLSQTIDRVPIYLIKHPQVGLLGAKVCCRRLIEAGHLVDQTVHLKAKL